MNAAGLTDPLLDRAVSLLHRELGLRPDPTMLSRVRRCLRDEAVARQQQPDAYIETLTADGDARQSLFDRITVQESSFFRHPGQFEALARHVLPDLPGPVSIWSAGCANGQEAYSLAMVLDEQSKPGAVIATDVSSLAQQRTAAARYLTRELGGLSNERRARHLIQRADDWEVRPSVRRRVTVRHHNLVTDPIPDDLAACQIVFCRNVLIYFSPQHVTSFLTRLANRLPAGACLFLGYAETIWQVTDLFEPVRIGDSFQYHRRRQFPLRARPAPQGKTAPAPRLGRSSHHPARASTPPQSPGQRSDTVAVAPTPPFRATRADLDQAGQLAAASGDYPAAITAFRKCVYLAPDEPIGQVHLGLALAGSGDHAAARRAFYAARGALGRCRPGDVNAALGGYRIEELLEYLDRQENPPQ